MRFIALTLIFFACTKCFDAQEKEIDRRIEHELRMNFPGIYFRHNSTEYAVMPYTADSCYKYIVMHLKEITSFVMWRDSSETERLTQSRIKRIKTGLNKYSPKGNVNILSMGKRQKISRHTIEQARREQMEYLLSLNSVFEISQARSQTRVKWKICWYCLLRVKKCQRNTFLFSKLF